MNVSRALRGGGFRLGKKQRPPPKSSLPVSAPLKATHSRCSGTRVPPRMTGGCWLLAGRPGFQLCPGAGAFLHPHPGSGPPPLGSWLASSATLPALVRTEGHSLRSCWPPPQPCGRPACPGTLVPCGDVLCSYPQLRPAVPARGTLTPIPHLFWARTRGSPQGFQTTQACGPWFQRPWERPRLWAPAWEGEAEPRPWVTVAWVLTLRGGYPDTVTLGHQLLITPRE